MKINWYHQRVKIQVATFYSLCAKSFLSSMLEILNFLIIRNRILARFRTAVNRLKTKLKETVGVSCGIVPTWKRESFVICIFTKNKRSREIRIFIRGLANLLHSRTGCITWNKVINFGKTNLQCAIKFSHAHFWDSIDFDNVRDTGAVLLI